MHQPTIPIRRASTSGREESHSNASFMSPRARSSGSPRISSCASPGSCATLPRYRSTASATYPALANRAAFCLIQSFMPHHSWMTSRAGRLPLPAGSASQPLAPRGSEIGWPAASDDDGAAADGEGGVAAEGEGAAAAEDAAAAPAGAAGATGTTGGGEDAQAADRRTDARSASADRGARGRIMGREATATRAADTSGAPARSRRSALLALKRRHVPVVVQAGEGVLGGAARRFALAHRGAGLQDAAGVRPAVV